MNTAPRANFLIIDGALRPGAIAGLYQRGEPLEVRPLYLGTRFRELHEGGPILASLSASSSLIRETYQRDFYRPDASLFYSSASINTVASHLQRFITPQNMCGGQFLLRFADPLVTLHWLDSFKGPALDTVLGPIEAWHVPEHPHSWVRPPSPVWRSFTRAAPAPGWVEAPAQLGDGQHSALDRASRWGFRERLHRMLEQNYPERLALIDKTRLAQWFDDRLDEAQSWGLFSERGCAIWTEYSLRWGQGFTEDQSGPYHQWLDHMPEALRLAPELRIQQMDKDCVIVNPHKEMP